MAYNSKVVQKVLGDFENKGKAAIHAAEKRKEELYKKFPELRAIDARLAGTYKEIIEMVAFSMINQGEDIQIKLENIKNNNKNLQKQRRLLLEENDYPADYTEPIYECSECSDSGYKKEEICGCLKRALAAESANNSGFGRIIDNFENFNLNYYDKRKSTDPKINESPYRHMKGIYEKCRDFADKFGESDAVKNLIFLGKPGLGKTHLSSAIAFEVIKKGFDVYYDSAQSILYSFEKERFARQSFNHEIIERYMTCDLLIIDDLGTEYSGSMSVSSLYNLINMRLTEKKSMIISTNLSLEDIHVKYDERIFSRIFREFESLNFVGDDVRFKK